MSIAAALGEYKTSVLPEDVHGFLRLVRQVLLTRSGNSKSSRVGRTSASTEDALHSGPNHRWRKRTSSGPDSLILSPSRSGLLGEMGGASLGSTGEYSALARMILSLSKEARTFSWPQAVGAHRLSDRDRVNDMLTELWSRRNLKAGRF